jgi:tetratricopeptide (TPR) repeat protein
VLVGSAQVTTALHADLLSALRRSPSETWAVLYAQGGWELVGRIVLGLLLGSIAGRWVRALWLRPRITEDARTMSREADCGELSALLQRAKAASDVQDYERVVTLLAPVRDALPHDVSVALCLADAYAELGRYEEAKHESRRAIALDPDNAVSHYNFGCLWRDMAEIDHAKHAFQDAIALNPAYVNAWMNLSELADDPREAIQCLERAQALGTQDSTIDTALAMWRALRDKGVEMGAQRLLWAEQALTKQDFTYVRLHLALARRCNLDDRLRAMAATLESDLLRPRRGDSPPHTISPSGPVRTARRAAPQGRVTGAGIDVGWSSLQRSKTLWQGLPDLTPYLWYGKINPRAATFQSYPQIQTAKRLIQKAIEYAPTSNYEPPQARVNEAIAFQELGLLHRALNEFQDASNAYQKSLEILKSLGGMSSNNTEVLAAYRETIFRLAELDHTLGNYEGAKAGYRESLQVDAVLGHNDPSGELYARKLLKQLEG